MLSGRREEALESLASEIRAGGEKARACVVDAMNERQVEDHLDEVVGRFGRLIAVFNAVGIRPSEHQYGTPAERLAFEAFLKPLEVHVGSQFLSARAAARHLKAGGTILLFSASLAADPRPLMAGITAACSAIEGLTRSLAAELGPRGIGVICLRPGAMHETRTIRETIEAHARTLGVTLEAFGHQVATASLLHRPVTVRETAEVASMLLSDRAHCMTGQVVNVSCGAVVW